jgi:hypothetical protein
MMSKPTPEKQKRKAEIADYNGFLEMDRNFSSFKEYLKYKALQKQAAEDPEAFEAKGESAGSSQMHEVVKSDFEDFCEYLVQEELQKQKKAKVE